MDTTTGSRTRGRQREAQRNDSAVIAAAREVFVENPKAAMADVAQRAGVGQASLYRRYDTKCELLNAVCADGMSAIGQAAAATLQAPSSYGAFASFMARYVESGAQLILAGTFEPTRALLELARHVHEQTQQVVERGIEAGWLRGDVTGTDLMLLAGQLGTICGAGGRPDRDIQQRYLALVLDGLRAPGYGPLPGKPPDYRTIERPWRSAGRANHPG